MWLGTCYKAAAVERRPTLKQESHWTSERQNPGMVRHAVGKVPPLAVGRAEKDTEEEPRSLV